MIPQPENIKTYPTTTAFPSKPSDLSREELEQHYLTLRGHYKGLMISRGQFAAKNRRVQAELEANLRQQKKLSEKLAQIAKEREEFKEVSRNLESLINVQSQLMQEFQTEYEAAKEATSFTSIISRLHRLINAASKLLSQTTLLPKKEIKKAEPVETQKIDEDLTDTSPRGIGKQLLDDK